MPKKDESLHTPMMWMDRLYWDARYVIYQELETVRDFVYVKNISGRLLKEGELVYPDDVKIDGKEVINKYLMENRIESDGDEEYQVNPLCGLSKDLSDEKYASLGVAINILFKTHFGNGSTVGFRIGRKHFTITRDE